MNTRIYGLLIIIVSILIGFSACQGFWNSETEDCEYPDYSDCDTQEPFLGDLKLWISPNSEAQIERIEVFYGKTDTGDTLDVIREFVELGDIVYLNVPVDAEYSAKAYYVKSPDTFVCVDGTKFNKKSYVNCDSTCWYLTGDEMVLIMDE